MHTGMRARVLDAPGRGWVADLLVELGDGSEGSGELGEDRVLDGLEHRVNDRRAAVRLRHAAHAHTIISMGQRGVTRAGSCRNCEVLRQAGAWRPTSLAADCSRQTTDEHRPRKQPTGKLGGVGGRVWGTGTDLQ
eukprot:159519-Rhodomonas_salina.1